MPNLVAGTGNPNSKLLILGEAPNATEDKTGIPFTGASGDFLDKLFTEIGYPNWRTDFWVTNVFQYRPPNNDIKLISTVCDIAQQEQRLKNEIAEVNPNCILAFGKTALKAVYGSDKILQYRGSILASHWSGRKVVSTIHPANMVRASNASGDHDESKGMFGYVWKPVIVSDIKRAIEESRAGRMDLPDRYLYECKDSVSLHRFLKRRAGKDRVFVDIETINSTIPGCISLAFDKHEAISIPLFQRIGNIKLTSIPITDLSFIWQQLDNLFRTIPVAGQNFKFDQQKLELIGFKFPKGLKSDTSLKAHTINPEIPYVGLAFISSIWTREPYYKDEGKEFIFGKHPIERWYLYNAKDSAVDCEVDEAQERELEVLSDLYSTDLKSFYYNYITHLHQLYFDIEKIGFKVDDGIRQYLISKYETWADHLEAKLLARIGRDINFNSPKQVKELLYDQMAIKPVNKEMKSDEKTIAQMLKVINNDTYREVLSDILEYRRVQKTLSTYLYAMPDFDGRMRTQYRIVGTETGRSSTSVLDEPTRPVQIGLAFQTLTKHGDIGSDIRSFLIADEGHVIVNIDLSQAEARVVALLSEDYELLEAFNHIDVHRRMASCALFTGKLNLSYEFDPIADILGKDSPERFIGKKSKHATNYDMKWREFMSVVIADCRRFGINFTISKFSAEKILANIHAGSPKVRSIFHAQVQEAINSTRALVNPFGRLRRFFDRPGDQLYKEAYANIPQSTVKDRLTQSLLKARKDGIPGAKKCNAETHDALTFMWPINEAVDMARSFKSYMELPISFRSCTLSRDYDLVIPCDFEWGYNYKELEKMKLT